MRLKIHINRNYADAVRFCYEGQAFEMYAKTNLKYAIRKLIRRVR